MTLKGLVQTTRWPEIKAALVWNDGNDAQQLSGYRAMLRRLRNGETTATSMRICLRMVEPEPFEGQRGSPYFDVFGRNGTLNKSLEDFSPEHLPADSDYADQETAWSLSMTPRTEWLGMQIDPETLAQCSAAQIVAACLEDMSFHGFEESQVEDVKAELKRQIAELDAMTPEERDRFLIPAEDVFSRFRERFDSADDGPTTP